MLTADYVEPGNVPKDLTSAGQLQQRNQGVTSEQAGDSRAAAVEVPKLVPRQQHAAFRTVLMDAT